MNKELRTLHRQATIATSLWLAAFALATLLLILT
mgnify:CR=1 FL=1